MAEKFRLGLTSDYVRHATAASTPDIGQDILEGHPYIDWEFMQGDSAILTPDDVRGYDGLVVFGSRVSKETFEGADRPTLVARFGVGYDTVDVPACTDRGVALTITPDGVRRPLASSYVAFILALGHNMMEKDRITRDSLWGEGSFEPGIGLQGRVLGLIGMGNIGREVFNLIRPFEMRYIAYDPYVKKEDAVALGVELVDLETLLSTADFVCVCCMLNDETYRLINADRLALMKRSAFLVNAARGPIVDQMALTTALRERRIQGAAVDAFEKEPIDPDDPILSLDNVIVTPHAMGMTDQCYQGIGRSAFKSVLEIAAGQMPTNTVNPEVANHPVFQEKLKRYAARS